MDDVESREAEDDEDAMDETVSVLGECARVDVVAGLSEEVDNANDVDDTEDRELEASDTDTSALTQARQRRPRGQD